MIKIIFLCIPAFCVLLSGCGSAPPKESPCIGLIVQDMKKGGQTSASQQAAGDAAPAADRPLSKVSDGTAGEITGQEQNTAVLKKGLSEADQLSLLDVSGKLNAIRKEIFSALDSIGSIDTAKFPKAGLEIIDEIEDALAESRHYLDHEAELLYTIPYIQDAYFDDLAENRLDGIVKTREIIHLYKTNLESLYEKLGKDADAFSPDDTLKHFESSIELLDKAAEILQPYIRSNQ